MENHVNRRDGKGKLNCELLKCFKKKVSANFFRPHDNVLIVFSLKLFTFLQNVTDLLKMKK